MVTLTMRHDRGQSLAELWSALSSAWRAVAVSRSTRAAREKLGVLGMVRRIEATHGERNGWHLHIHALVFAGPDASGPGFDELAESMAAVWARRLVREGLEAPSEARGVDVRVLDLARPSAVVAQYVTVASTPSALGAGAELADAGGKGGRLGNRTPWQLLAAAKNGDARAAGLWREWEEVSAGEQALTWGRKVRAATAMPDDTTDVEAADAGAWEGVVLADLPADVWAEVARRPAGPVDVLEAAEDAFKAFHPDKARGGPEAWLAALHDAHEEAAAAVRALLHEWGIPRPPPARPKYPQALSRSAARSP